MADIILPEPPQPSVASASSGRAVHEPDAPRRCVTTNSCSMQTEIWLLILDYINLNGDVASFGHTCGRFHDIVDHQTPSLLRALQTTYALPPLLVTPPSLPNLLRLQSQLHDLQTFPLSTVPHSSRASLLLTSHIHHLLTTPANHSSVTIPSPLPTLTATITTRIPTPYIHTLRALPLASLDSYITGLNHCALTLWQCLEAHELSALTRHALSLISEDNHSNVIDLERAVCAEVAIWRGVSWCLHFARDVRHLRTKRGSIVGSSDDEYQRRYRCSMSGALTARSLLAGTARTDGRLETLWQGRASEAVKLAGGGLAAWLSRERKARYEEVVALNDGCAPLGVRPCLRVGVP